MTTMTGEKILEHYGVKGMQWGKRKSRNESERAKTFGNSSKKNKKKPRDVKDIDDKDLQRIVQRMNMEKQYKSLTRTPSQLEKGTKAVGSILAVGATVNSAIAFSRSPAGQTLKKALTR